MTDDYTPTTEEVRGRSVMGARAGRMLREGLNIYVADGYSADEFDRWLNDVQEQAFDMGWRFHFDEIQLQKADPGHPITDRNPFRKERTNDV